MTDALDSPASAQPPSAAAGLPAMDEGRFTSGQAARFGVRILTAADGESELVLPGAYGDERDADPLFVATAFDYAIDIAALIAVRSRIDPTREQPNGTASLHVSRLATPSGDVTLRGRVVFWSAYEALVELAAVDAAGHDVARGLSAYSLRPVISDAATDAGGQQ